MPVKRIAGAVKFNVIGQADRQVFFLFWHYTACFAVNDRDRAAPIALTAQPPVAQTVIGDTCAPALVFGKGNGCVNRLLSCGDIQTGEMVDPLHLFGFWRNEGLICHRGFIAHGIKGINHWQFVFAGKIQIALVMRRTGKNGPCAVIHQDKIGDPNRQFPIGIQRVAHPKTGIDAFLFGLFHIRF